MKLFYDGICDGIFRDENLQMKYRDSNMYPILLSNQLMASSHKSFPINIEKK